MSPLLINPQLPPPPDRQHQQLACISPAGARAAACHRHFLMSSQTTAAYSSSSCQGREEGGQQQQSALTTLAPSTPTALTPFPCPPLPPPQTLCNPSVSTHTLQPLCHYAHTCQLLLLAADPFASPGCLRVSTHAATHVSTHTLSTHTLCPFCISLTLLCWLYFRTITLNTQFNSQHTRRCATW
jgi:hypothetical protein